VAKLAVVRVRGDVGVKRGVLDTLHLLGLTRVNHCVLAKDDPATLGMLLKVKDVVTWGEVSSEVLAELLRKRGRLTGNKKLSDEHVRSSTGLASIDEFAVTLHSGSMELKAIPGLKKVFRLHPPSKGYEATKRPFKVGGSLGYRGEKINDLIRRMM